MYVCMNCQIFATLKKCLISVKQSITATIEGNGTDIIYVGKLEIHTVLTYHGTTKTVWSGPLLIVLHLALTGNTLDTTVLSVRNG